MLKATLVIILTLLFSLPTISFSKELNNKIKFHPPETEAEKALDVILRVENGIAVNKPNIKEEILTKDFLKEELGQVKYYEECAKGNIWCNKNKIEPFFAINHIAGSQFSEKNHIFCYITQSRIDDILYIDVRSKSENAHGDKCEEIEFSSKDYKKAQYAMKKEDSKWKIDGICSVALGINHHHCYSLGFVDYNDINALKAGYD